jgi:hypothetical protein
LERKKDKKKSPNNGFASFVPNYTTLWINGIHPQADTILWESDHNFMGIESAGDIPILLKILHFSVFKDDLRFLV